MLNKKTLKLAALFTLAMICGGCTGSVQIHYPGGWQAIDTYAPGQTTYKAYRENPNYPEM